MLIAKAADAAQEAYQLSLDDLGTVRQVETSLEGLLVQVRGARERLETKTQGLKKDLQDAGQIVPLGVARGMPGHQPERRSTTEYCQQIGRWLEQFTR